MKLTKICQQKTVTCSLMTSGVKRPGTERWRKLQSHQVQVMIFGLNSCTMLDSGIKKVDMTIILMKPFIMERKEKKIDAQDDNTLPTLKVSQQEPTSVSKKKKK